MSLLSPFGNGRGRSFEQRSPFTQRCFVLGLVGSGEEDEI